MTSFCRILAALNGSIVEVGIFNPILSAIVGVLGGRSGQGQQ